MLKAGLQFADLTATYLPFDRATLSSRGRPIAAAQHFDLVAPDRSVGSGTKSRQNFGDFIMLSTCVWSLSKYLDSGHSAKRSLKPTRPVSESEIAIWFLIGQLAWQPPLPP
jgi:hypothetical protein